MINAVIIDDENAGRDILSDLLAKHCPQVKVLAEAGSVAAGLETIKTHRPALVFLDIEMPDGSGFDLLERARNVDFDVIFITAYDQYAIKAFRYAAADYLLKPVRPQELAEAVNRVIDKRSTKTTTESLGVLLQNIKQPSNELKKIALPSVNGFTFIQVHDILRCESTSSYTTFYLTTKEKITVSRSIKEYEELLPADKFFRVHQSHLINLAHIKKYIKGDSPQLVMSDDTIVPVARRKKDELLQKLAIG